MKPPARPEIERALRFIAENLERPITVADVARAAHLSEFHLHRVFHAQLGESVGRFITRRRLELSALRLAYETDRSITDIALSSGYSSSSNFAKAFSAYFGCSPSRLREPEPAVPASIGKLISEYGQDFRAEALYSAPPPLDPELVRERAAAWTDKVRFENVAGQYFACLAASGGYEAEGLERTFHELIKRARQLGLCAGPVDTWGIAYDSPQLTAPELCRFHACVPCPAELELPAPLFRGHMLPGRYAVFDYSGPVSQVAEAYRSIYSCWFRESSVAPADYEPLGHFVTDFPEQGAIEFEMWFRVRPRRG